MHRQVQREGQINLIGITGFDIAMNRIYRGPECRGIFACDDLLNIKIFTMLCGQLLCNTYILRQAPHRIAR